MNPSTETSTCSSGFGLNVGTTLVFQSRKVQQRTMHEDSTTGFLERIIVAKTQGKDRRICRSPHDRAASVSLSHQSHSHTALITHDTYLYQSIVLKPSQLSNPSHVSDFASSTREFFFTQRATQFGKWNNAIKPNEIGSGNNAINTVKNGNRSPSSRPQRAC